MKLRVLEIISAVALMALVGCAEPRGGAYYGGGQEAGRERSDQAIQYSTNDWRSSAGTPGTSSGSTVGATSSSDATLQQGDASSSGTATNPDAPSSRQGQGTQPGVARP